MSKLSDPLPNTRLFIAHLAQRLEELEVAERPNPVAYRLFAKRMYSAMSGYPEALLEAQLGNRHPSVIEALEQRHFEAHGAFRGLEGRQARETARRLMGRLGYLGDSPPPQVGPSEPA